MTPRSLVGMTMGARKRDARHAPVERFCTNCKIPLRLYDEVEPTPAESAGFIDPDSYACPKCRSETDNLRSDDKRAETRSFYRIGQRLRPCPGEYRCTKCSQNNWCRCTDTEADAACVICGVLQHWPCDGSGVLPARAKKVRR